MVFTGQSGETAEVLKLKMDSMYLYVPFFGELCKVSRRDGNIRKADDSAVLVEDRLTIMQHLHYYKQTAMESTKRVAFREIKEAAVFEKAYQKSSLKPLVRAFSNHLEELRLAGKKLQGKKESLVMRAHAAGVSENFAYLCFLGRR